MRWPADPCLGRATAGTAKARSPNRDLAEQRGNLVGSVVFDLAYGATGPAFRPPDGMVPALRRSDCLLNAGQKLLAFRVRQTEIRKIAEITGAVDRHHVDTAGRTFDPALHQAQNPPHP
jgi:hypothetical protein